MGLFARKEFHAGQEFGKHVNRKNALKKGLLAYARMMKSAYTPHKDKRSIKEKMESMKMELERLNEEEKYYGMQRTVRNKKAMIKKMKPPSTLDRILSSSDSGSQYFTKIPDYLNTMGGGGKRKKSGSLDFKIPKVF